MSWLGCGVALAKMTDSGLLIRFGIGVHAGPATICAQSKSWLSRSLLDHVASALLLGMQTAVCRRSRHNVTGRSFDFYAAGSNARPRMSYARSRIGVLGLCR